MLIFQYWHGGDARKHARVNECLCVRDKCIELSVFESLQLSDHSNIITGDCFIFLKNT